ncbi:hypothetical protein NEAUS05_1684 [Nematocida ausubeli]|nr:hypothetical protein NEAUS07_1735 [Nematocida ausubeli]KAI5149215.1 hypothetical protein NEAUS05_1684 [Nematocida ausubeli]
MGLSVVHIQKRVLSKELSAQSTRKEGKRRGAWSTAVCVLIQLAMLCQVWGRLRTNKELMSIQKREFTFMDKGKEKTLVIGPDSALSPLRGRIADSIRVMHNKRFLSPEIKIEHSIAVKKNAKGKIEIAQTRDYRLDRVHDDSDLAYKGSLLKYKRAYFNTLLELFPSMHGYVSIWSDREDSFFSFINSTSVEKYKYKILASLLLLAEGVDVPLAINESESRTELVLKKADEGEHFRVSTKIEDSDEMIAREEDSSASGKNIKLERPAVASVVKFFIENRENPVLKKEGYTSEPKSYKEFKKGKFMNSPGFLIQTYVYHCMGNEDQTVLFIKAVYDLLCEYMAQEKEAPREFWLYRVKNYLENKYVEWKEGRAENIQVSQAGYELPRAAKRVFGRYFVPLEQISLGMEYIDVARKSIYNHILHHQESLLHLEPIVDAFSVQKNRESLDACTPNEACPSATSDLASTMGGADYGETALLGLFCWALYNCEESTYTVDHIEFVSEELKSFFKIHKYMDGAISKSMHDDWNKVIGGLSNWNIRYLQKGRKQLAPGIINMLYVIKEITGVGDAKKIDEFREKLECMDNKHKIRAAERLHSELTNDVSIDKKQKDQIEQEIRQLIDEKELSKKKLFEWRLKCAGKGLAPSIKLEIKSLKGVIKERKKEELNALFFDYVNKEKTLAVALKSDISKYLTETINKIAIKKEDINADAEIEYKETLKGGYSDLFGKIKISYTLDDAQEKDAHLANTCSYEFNVYPKYCADKVVGLGWETGSRLHSTGCALEEAKLSRIKKKTFIAEMLRFHIDREVEMCTCEPNSRSQPKPNKMLQDALFCGKQCRPVDALLLGPAAHSRLYKRDIIWALLLHIVDKNLGRSHPLVHLVNNAMGGVLFATIDDINAVLVLLSHTLEDTYYPNIAIDGYPYRNASCFTNTIEKALEWANSTEFVSQETYAGIITKIVASLQRDFPENKCNPELEHLVKGLNTTEKSVFAKIILHSVTTAGYTSQTVQTVQEAEKENSVDVCERHTS